MGSYQILGRFAKMQNAYNFETGSSAGLFLLYCSNIFNKKKCSAYNDDRRRMQCLFLKEQV